MFDSYELGYYIYFVVVGIAVFYLYKAIKQIKSKDVDFYSKDRYTDASVSKWAVVDGFLKVAAAVVFATYGILGLLEINILYITIALLVVILVAYFVLYSKTLVKKDDYV
jgi:hypothetical protein